MNEGNFKSDLLKKVKAFFMKLKFVTMNYFIQ